MNLKNKYWIIVLFALILIFFIAYFSFFIQKSINNISPSEVIIPVKTAKIEIRNVLKNIYAFGTVTPAPGAIDVVSVTFESYIVHLMVNDGQMVLKGESLIEIQPSQNTSLSFAEAERSFKTTQSALQHVKELLDLKLATNDQFLNAQLAFQQAQLRLENMKKQGVEGPKIFWLIRMA